MKIRQIIAIAALISGSAGAAAPPPVTAVDFGPQTLTLINSYRTSRGLSPLAENATLKALALQHSRYQAARRTISHDGYRQRSAQAKAAGLSGLCTENVGIRYRNAQHLFSGWRNSRAHNQNLLRPDMRYAGVAVVGDYATFFACG
ncbi:CAP domain-containing protein [Sinorhizobium sp. CB7]|uniref:CAP domain-containing protein n=1 Tax=Sinorhizobium sp. CB7 TaxID=3056949 RepID=UPI003523D12B